MIRPIAPIAKRELAAFNRLLIEIRNAIVETQDNIEI